MQPTTNMADIRNCRNEVIKSKFNEGYTPTEIHAWLTQHFKLNIRYVLMNSTLKGGSVNISLLF
jgi:hypothetical protein